MTPETEKYFEEQNIQVYFDTLGKTKALKAAYIDATQKLVDANPTKRSEMVKHACYSQFYPMRQREKLTGFEQFAELDKQYRIDNKEYIGEDIFRHSNLFEKSEKSSIILPYKTQLGLSYEEYNKPILLYLSGGLDSELVARSLIEFGINFTPVIFNWGNKKGEIVNSNDTQYAFDLCKEVQLTPIVKTVNIDELWLSTEFKRLGKAIRILSPHLTTHAYMVELMNAEKPDHIHLLGGEVRYKSDFDEIKTDGFVTPNLVYAEKTMPASIMAEHPMKQLAYINANGTVHSVNISNPQPGFGSIYFADINGNYKTVYPISTNPLASAYQSGIVVSTYRGSVNTTSTGWLSPLSSVTATVPTNSFSSVGIYSLMTGTCYLKSNYNTAIASSTFTVDINVF